MAYSPKDPAIDLILEFMKHEEGSANQAAECDRMIPMQLISEVKGRENAENRQRDDLLDHLQLIRRERPGSNSIRRDL